mgnify:CR=1 FL=1|jgi:hypothetical protein
MIKWGDSNHKIAVTNELCNHLESNGINLFKMQMDLNSGQTPKFFLLGNLIAQLLKHAGILVTQDDVMRKLTKEPADSVEIFQFALTFMSMIFPAVDESDLGKPKPETAKT